MPKRIIPLLAGFAMMLLLPLASPIDAKVLGDPVTASECVDGRLCGCAWEQYRVCWQCGPPTLQNHYCNFGCGSPD